MYLFLGGRCIFNSKLLPYPLCHTIVTMLLQYIDLQYCRVVCNNLCFSVLMTSKTASSFCSPASDHDDARNLFLMETSPRKGAQLTVSCFRMNSLETERLLDPLLSLFISVAKSSIKIRITTKKTKHTHILLYSLTRT